MSIISVISLFYQAFRGNKYVSLVMSGMSAGVAAVVLDVVISMTGDVIKTKRVLPTAMLVAVFILAYFFDVSVILLIIASGVVGYIDGVFTKRRNAK